MKVAQQLFKIISVFSSKKAKTENKKKNQTPHNPVPPHTVSLVKSSWGSQSLNKKQVLKIKSLITSYSSFKNS